MPVGLLKDIIAVCPRKIPLLGLDVGKKTIGLALSDPDQSIATPLQTLKRTKFTADAEVLTTLIREYEVGGLVIGLPVNMDGSEGRRAQSVRDFAAELYRQLPSILSSFGLTEGSIGPAIKSQGDTLSYEDPFIALWDERLSTETVEAFVDRHVKKRKKRVNAKSSGLIDKLAAQLILQGALDFMQENQP